MSLEETAQESFNLAVWRGRPLPIVIHTCRLNGLNPFDYLMAIATHPEAVQLIPKAWLPWNYPKSPTSSQRL